MRNYTSLFLLLLVLVSASCTQEEPNSGSFQLSFNVESNANGRTASVNISSLLISVASASGEVILDQELIEVNKFGDDYISAPILLEIGKYSLTKFLVLNDNDEIVYGTPIEGSALAGLVDNPLPLSFDVASDEVSSVSVQVIPTDSYDPEDLGYSAISFSIVPTQDILISVLNYVSGSYQFTESSLAVIADGDSSYTTLLGDSINVVRLRSDYSELNLVFELSGGQSQTIGVSSEELSGYRTVPLLVVFGSDSLDLTSDIVAYYPFNGDASEASGNGPDGVLGDGAGNAEPVLTTDRHGSANEAYYFNGGSYIDLGENELFDIVDYPEFSMALWSKRDTGTSGTLFSKYIAAGQNRMWQIRDNKDRVGYFTYDNGEKDGAIDSVTLPSQAEIWQHVAVTYENSIFYLYYDGVLIDSAAHTVTTIPNSPTAKTLIGGVHFSNELFDALYQGSIDEVYFYSRALTSQEVKALSEL